MFLIQKSGESRIQPGTLNNLSKFALTLLIVVLVVITLLNVRERKYEIGVLTEIGADKVKVAAQSGRDMQGPTNDSSDSAGSQDSNTDNNSPDSQQSGNAQSDAPALAKPLCCY